MAIWVNNTFTGFWPVGTAAVIVADARYEAAEYLSQAITKRGLPPQSPNELVVGMSKVKQNNGSVTILNDGNY